MTSTKSSKNALSHGAYSSQLILAWEKEQDFKDLHRSIREELRPEGALEEAAVFELASLHWKKRRLEIGSQLAFCRDQGASELENAGRNGWEGIIQYVESKLQVHESLRDDVRNIVKSHLTMAQSAQAKFTALEANKQEGASSDDTQLKELARMLKEISVNSGIFIQGLRAVESLKDDEDLWERAYRPDRMERELKILADFDKRIEKTLVRVAWLKEHKKLYRPKEMNVLPAAAILPAKGEVRELSGSPELSPSNDDAEPTTLSAR
jgi:hypothetical protein